jgi:hypothetical protein
MRCELIRGFNTDECCLSCHEDSALLDIEACEGYVIVDGEKHYIEVCCRAWNQLQMNEKEDYERKHVSETDGR